MMTFKQLEALYWVGALGSFALAANKLHTTQSAVSKRVQELEAVFDIELFDRSQRSARLTDKGEEMFMLAKRLLDQRDAAIEQFGRADVIERRVRIGVTELTAMTWLPRWVQLIQSHHPRVTLEPDVDSSANLREKLFADELDLIVVPDAFSDTRLTNTAVGAVDSAWMCRPGLLGTPAPTRLHELAAHRLLVQGAKSGTGMLYDSWMRELGIAPARPIVIHNLVALIGLTISGLGVSYLPREALRPMVEQGTLQVLDIAPALPRVSYVACSKNGHSRSLFASIVMLAQSCCDFTRMFQAGQDDAGDPGAAA